MTPTTLADTLTAILGAEGLDGPENQSYHGWRCQHPDRYEPCDDFAQLVVRLAAALLALPPDRRAAIAAELLDVETLARALVPFTRSVLHDDVDKWRRETAAAILAALRSPQ